MVFMRVLQFFAENYANHYPIINAMVFGISILITNEKPLTIQHQLQLL